MTAGRDDRRAQRFIRESLLALGEERPGLREALRAVRDWECVLAETKACGVSEAIWSAMLLRELDEEVPEPFRLEFQIDHEAAIGRNTLLLLEAAAYQAALAAAGIDSVVLKGPALLVAHYRDAGARNIGDVDVLVRARDLDRAVAVARERGARVEEDPGLGYDGEMHAGHAHHAPFLRSASGVVLEIHGAIPGGSPHGTETDGILARARQVEWEGIALRVPSAADLVAGACLHVFDHHLGDPRYVWRQLADLAVTVGAGATAWDEVKALVPSWGGRAAVDASRALLETGTIPALTLARCRVHARVLRWQGDAARAGGAGGGLRFLFPDRRYMSAKYGVIASSPALPALYVWRIVRRGWAAVTGR